MRRAFTAILAAATLAAGFSIVPAAALAGDRDSFEHSDHHSRDHDRSRRGYWERPSDRRRGWSRYNHRRRTHHDDGVSYYPGHGYYPDAGYREGRGRDRSEWCARRYRSYDWRSGTYVTYDGVRRYCG